LVTRGQSVAQVIESIMNGVQVPDYR
jgi:hypothetical protein